MMMHLCKSRTTPSLKKTTTMKVEVHFNFYFSMKQRMKQRSQK